MGSERGASWTVVLGSPLSSLELPSLLLWLSFICPWSGERWVGGWDHTLAISFCRRDIASHLHTVTHVCFASVRSTRHRVPICTSSHTFVAPRRPARPSRRFSGSLGCSQARSAIGRSAVHRANEIHVSPRLRVAGVGHHPIDTSKSPHAGRASSTARWRPARALRILVTSRRSGLSSGGPSGRGEVKR